MEKAMKMSSAPMFLTIKALVQRRRPTTRKARPVKMKLTTTAGTTRGGIVKVAAMVLGVDEDVTLSILATAPT